MNIAGKVITDMHHFVYSKISCKLKSSYSLFGFDLVLYQVSVYKRKYDGTKCTKRIAKEINSQGEFALN